MSRFLENFQRPLEVVRISGIPVRIDLRWLFVFALMSWVAGSSLTPRYVENYPVAIGVGAITTLILFACILVHEFGHSVVARREGVEVVEILLHPFGGLARFRREPETPKAELRIAIAGPITSLLLAGIFGLLTIAARAIGNEALFVVLFVLTLWNFMLAVFNMFPGYPLDGGRVLRAYLWRRGTELNEATVIAGKSGKIIAVALIVLGIVVALLRGDLVSGIWSVLIGIFLYDSARRIIAEVLEFENTIVEDAMRLPVTVVPEMTVLEFVNTVVPKHRRTVYLVSKNKQFYGVLMLEDLKPRPRETWHKIRIQDAMRPVEPDFFIETSARIAEARVLLRENGINALGVVDSRGHLVGYLQRGRIRRMT